MLPVPIMKAIVVLCTLSVYVAVGEVCPDKGSCAPGMTCCVLPSGREGCCPYLNGTCCQDRVHCCPNGYDCQNSRCRKRDDSTEVNLERLMVYYDEQYTNSSLNSNYCPDQSQCDDDETCCSVGGGRYGCCPMLQAVCCRDLRTCCPQGYTCMGSGGCQLEDKVIEGMKVAPKSVVCPGGRYKCPDYNTCCRTQTGRFACCPLNHAVCCRDGKHCCPNGYTCDAYSQQCNPN